MYRFRGWFDYTAEQASILTTPEFWVAAPHDVICEGYDTSYLNSRTPTICGDPATKMLYATARTALGLDNGSPFPPHKRIQLHIPFFLCDHHYEAMFIQSHWVWDGNLDPTEEDIRINPFSAIQADIELILTKIGEI